MMVQILKPVLSFAVISSLVFSNVSTCFAGRTDDDEMEIGSRFHALVFEKRTVTAGEIMGALNSAQSSVIFDDVIFKILDQTEIVLKQSKLPNELTIRNSNLDPVALIIKEMINTGRNSDLSSIKIDLSKGNSMSQENRMILLALMSKQVSDFRKTAVPGPVVKWWFNSDDKTVDGREISTIRELLAQPKRELCDFELSVTNKELLEAQDRLMEDQSGLKKLTYQAFDRPFQFVFGTKSKGYERGFIVGTAFVSTFVMAAMMAFILECVILHPDSCEL